MMMLVSGVSVELRSVRVLRTSASVKVNGALPDWAAPEGQLTLGFKIERAGASVRVRTQLVGTADDGSFTARAELLLTFARQDDGELPTEWPANDEYAVICLAWPHARAALQAAAFSVDGLLPLPMLPPTEQSHLE